MQMPKVYVVNHSTELLRASPLATAARAAISDGGTATFVQVIAFLYEQKPGGYCVKL